MRINQMQQHIASLLCFSFVASLFGFYPAAAQWANDPTVNTPISRSYDQEWDPLIVSDGADGAIIVWKHYVGSASGFDIMAQRIDAGGTIQWLSGAVICSAPGNQENYSIISDGSGGAIITWNDQRGGTTSYDIYAQKVDASGQVKWQKDGISISTAADVQANPKIVSDGSGGAIITWRDSRNYLTTGVDIYAQRVNSSGNVQWAANGVVICTALANQMDPEITTDGSGGAIVAWSDERDLGTLKVDVYCQRVNASGNVQWTANGVGFKANGNQSYLKIASDGSGGAFITWQDDYFGVNDQDIGALRINSNGSFPWTPTSIWIARPSGNQVRPRVVSDGSGGAIFAWQDHRNGATNPDIYAMRIDGSPASLWPGSSGLICNANGRQEAPRLVSDDFGGAIITWHDYRNGQTDVYTQRVDPNGVVQWTANGVEICTAAKPQNNPTIVKAGPCGAIITWSDQRWVGDPNDDTDWDIYAQRVFCDGKLSQQSITLDVPNGGESWQAGTEHFIVWHGQGIDNYDVKIEYSTDNGANYNFIDYKTNSGQSDSYAWDVPNTPSTQCLVRVSVNFPPEISDVSDASFAITAAGGNNTPTGNNVEVDLGSGVKAMFDNVTGTGNTTLVTKTSGPAPPGGFTIIPSSSPFYYSITTTATYSGNITVCIQYNDAGMTPAQEAALKLQVYEQPPGQWNDITSSLDTNTNTICGTVTHFSDFAVMMPAGGVESITVVQPNGQEQWPVGSQQEIKWTSANFTGNVRIKYSPDYTNTYYDVVSSTENDGSYMWTIPDTPSDLSLVLVEDAVDGQPWDMSDGVFSIIPAQIGGLTVQNADDSGPGSLRDAIQQANANAGPDTIRFNIPKNVPGHDPDTGVWFIQPLSPLPVISDNGLVIDASTQTQISVNPHGPEIVIDGSKVGGEFSGLTITAAGTEVYSLTINRFPRAGIEMNGVEGGRIAGCFLGTDFAGTDAAGNGNGIYLLGKSIGVEIVPLNTFPNVISGNTYSGIFISDSSAFNIVVGNIIGRNRDGTFAVGNLLQGIVIQDGSKSNEIRENLIGGNNNGVSIYGSSDNVVAHNQIGTDETWELEAGNEDDGIYIASGASGNRVIENIIGYNGGHGIYVHGSDAIGNSITQNGISLNGGSGIRNGSGGNNELTPPVILSVSSAEVTGTAGSGQIIEVFADDEDEGRIFLGSVTADASGNFALSFQEPVPLPNVTATCTDSEGNTSEFCPPFIITSVQENPKSPLPTEFRLSQNYPNPFNPETVIRYTLPRKSFVKLQIINLLGEVVVTLVNEEQDVDLHSVKWNGTDEQGRRVTSGIYLYRIQASEFIDVKKMLLLK